MQMDNSLLERMPFPYFIISKDFRILYASKSARQQFSIPVSFIDLVHSPHKMKLQDFLNSADSCHLELIMENTFHCSENLIVYKLCAGDGTIHLFCIPTKTNSGETKDAVNHSDQLAVMGQLAAGIAHEIRNPLTTVKGFIQLIKPYLSEIGKEEYALIAIDEIDRANGIIYEFLNAAKPSQNKKQLMAVNKLLKDIILLFESEAIFKNLEMETFFHSEDVKVYTDIKQMKQVLVNLIKNAIEAIEENHFHSKGKIQIRTNCHDSNVIIEIEDNGVGISKETIASLFTPFYSTKEKGTGIGLSVCKQIIEDHGGKIHVTSEPFLGTSFRIELPIYQH